jgi:hypothetical protein
LQEQSEVKRVYNPVGQLPRFAKFTILVCALELQLPHNFDRKYAKTPDAQRSVPEMPAWAEGIRTLYDAISHEPLPTDFQTLLNELGKSARR